MESFIKNPVVRFLFWASVGYLIWLMIYYLYIKTHTNWDYYLDYSIVYLSQSLFDLLGIATTIEIESDHVILLMDGVVNTGVWVGDECNGFKLFSIFTIFILAYPGNWKTKAWYIPVGILLIHFANIIRVMALLAIYEKWPEFLDFNHNYTFTIFVYSIIFILWIRWAKKHGNVKKA
ncbi:MAG: archaeosortase/exosortase family protein [Crocinitomicaceae bacterium]|nr:archaeosortase/exosortase family protein [Crocinitomicaceae bacterium]MBK8925243.1 archaeosortase/exosortase family protein [Crocinitomicaceae bacterium]